MAWNRTSCRCFSCFFFRCLGPWRIASGLRKPAPRRSNSLELRALSTPFRAKSVRPVKPRGMRDSHRRHPTEMRVNNAGDMRDRHIVLVSPVPCRSRGALAFHGCHVRPRAAYSFHAHGGLRDRCGCGRAAEVLESLTCAGSGNGACVLRAGAASGAGASVGGCRGAVWGCDAGSRTVFEFLRHLSVCFRTKGGIPLGHVIFGVSANI